MAASDRGNDAVLRAAQLVQYEDEDDNDDKLSGQLRAGSNTIGGDIMKRDALDSNAHPGGKAGMDEAEDGRRADRVNQDEIVGRAQDDVYIETSFREVIQQTTHTVGGEGGELASEDMSVFCSYETTTVVGHNEEAPAAAASGNDYSEEDLQERGLEEAALEERVHGGDQSPGFLPEEAGRGEDHSSFSGTQQLQLRAQILVYGDLIKGVLPDQNLMSSAFSDDGANEGAEQEADRIPGGLNWEAPWQVAVERREVERLAEEDRNNKGDVTMPEGEPVNPGAENLEPGTPSTSPIRVAEDPIRDEGIPAAAMLEAGGTAAQSVAPSLDDQPTDVNGAPIAVVDSIAATSVSGVDGVDLKESGAVAEVARSPSLDPWLKPPPSQVAAAPSLNAGLASEAAAVSTPSVVLPVAGVVDSTGIGNAEVSDEGTGKRRSRARERKTPAAPKSVTATPRRSRAKAATQMATPASVPAVATSRLTYESSEAVVIVQGTSPASVGAGKARDAQGRSNLQADTQTWLEQAKASFEEAVSAANSVAEQVQLVKSVTATPKSGKEAQLASAAAAVNAAASVAQAAAEAAKVAYEAALQATMMVSDGIDSGLGKFGVGNGQGDKDGGLGQRRSLIAAAKEEARKRPAASTPSMKTTPQTTDAVLRAARLMAEAASQAGAVLAKGNTGTPPAVPLSPVSQLDLKRSGGRNRAKKESTSFKSPDPIKTGETEPPKSVKGSMKKGARRRGKELQELAASNSSAQKGRQGTPKLSPRQLDQFMASASTIPDVPEIVQQSMIVEGSLVEVMNDEEGLRGGWFSAKVLELRTGEAFVQYDALLTDDGATLLKEWFPLEGPLDGTELGRPRIRVISPNNLTRDEARRKRRRGPTGSTGWRLGDRVDAFVQDGWWEGIIKVMHDSDESKMTVHFPGEGDTSVVKSYNLRPSFFWKSGQWEQWVRPPTSETIDTVQDGDGQQSKKQKVESPKVQARKSGRAKSNPAEKNSDESTESVRASKRLKANDTPSSNPLSPSISTRSSPRQKLPAKRKEEPTAEVSTPTHAPTPTPTTTPVSTRTRSVAQDAVNPVTEEPLQRSAPSRTKPDVEHSENLFKDLKDLKDLGVPRVLRNSEPIVPSEEKKTPATRQKAVAVADVVKPATRSSARL